MTVKMSNSCSHLEVLLPFHSLLNFQAELPRASQTSTLSGAGVKRIFKSVGEVSWVIPKNYSRRSPYDLGTEMKCLFFMVKAG